MTNVLKSSWLCCCFALVAIQATAQEKPYFQQRADYEIAVTLNDQKHELYGDASIVYTNNSPDALTEIYMHLWANAYQNGTALAAQFLRTNETKMHYAPAEDLGAMEQLDFKINGETVAWSYDEKHKDIAILKLKTPLRTGEKLTISTPFLVKIPASFSRLGHVEESYQMTQWYPKPAVYDRYGWHPMPYLNFGEFFSEFGSFDVKITLPQNYVVGATGVLQNEEERAFLMEKVAMTNAAIAADTFGSNSKKVPFPPSTPEIKTLHYKAENVHDFAWFADKRFYVQHGEVVLASGAKVETWTMFTDYEAKIWKDALQYVNRSVQYYSERIGEYPYPHATAVQSALSAGGGMEYPMITVIGPSGEAKSLDIVITHEVGHNWFYGILGSNERDYPWMDEGLNSYYESDYTIAFYGKKDAFGIPENALKLLDAENLDAEKLMYLWQARQKNNQPMNTTSDELTMINYQLSAYSTPSMMFKYLESYLGTEIFDGIMQKYFKEWKFKHPYPQDLRKLFEAETDKDLGWLFGDFFNSRQRIDYSLKSVKAENGSITLTVRNEGDIAAPVVLSAYDFDTSGMAVNTWFEGFEGTKTFTIPAVEGAKYMIDAKGAMLEINRQNNYDKTPVKLRLLGGIENEKKKSLYFTPTLAFNTHDGLMLGLGFYNRVFPARDFEFAFTPMYGFGSQTVTGLGSVDYTFRSEKGWFKSVKLGLHARSFSGDSNDNFDYELRYTLVKPSVRFELQRSDISSTKQFVTLNYRHIRNETPNFVVNPDIQYTGKTENLRNVYEAAYSLNRKTAFNTFKLDVSLLGEAYERRQETESYVRATVEAQYRWNYPQLKKRGLDVRVFAGKFLQQSDADFGSFPLNLAANSSTDYYYDEFFFGRGAQDNFWARQISLAQGGFKMPTTSSVQNGASNDLIVTMNVKADLPFKSKFLAPIKPYVDFGYFKETAPSITDPVEFFYNAGIALDFFDGGLGIYFPIIGTDLLMNQQPNFGSRISFNIDLNRLNVLQILNNFSIGM